MEIREYLKADREQLISLWETVFPGRAPHNEPSSVKDSKLLVDNLVFVADIGNKIIGAYIAGYDGHRGWLYALCVDDKYRRNWFRIS